MKKLLLAIALGLSAPALVFAATEPASPAFSQKPFTDVKASHANYDAIEYLRGRNILKGYTDGTFRADTRITRAEFVMLMTNPLFLAGERSNDCLNEFIGTGATVFFPDVRRDDWFADQVCIGKTKGLIHGYDDGRFRPNQPINFVETAKIAATVFALQVRRDDEGGDDRWFTAYVQKLGGLNAIPSSITQLDELMTRGEMAEILYRLHANVQNKSHTTWQSLLQ